VLDVGCATGELCGALAASGLRPTGVDLNPWFVEAAKVHFPNLPFRRADMRSLPFRARFDGLVCMGSTLLYALSNHDLLRALHSFRRALRPGGWLLLDVLNASALIARQVFRRRSVHRFAGDITAVIRHSFDARGQALTEQVTWSVGRERHRDPATRLRLLFPMEVRLLLESVGFEDVSLLGDFRRGAIALHGRRMIAIARKRGTRRV